MRTARGKNGVNPPAAAGLSELRALPDGGPTDLPSEAVRGGVTLLLALYLVGLLLCVAGNSASGSSALVRTIKTRLFSPWMVPLWLDLAYDTRLTYGTPDDADHFLELRPWNAPASATGATLRLPASGMRGERAARWRRLARAIVIGQDDADREGILPAAVAEGMFASMNAEDLSLRVLRTIPPDRAVESAGGRGTIEQAYACRVRRVAGEVQLLPLPPAGEVAPLLPGDAPLTPVSRPN